MPLFFRDPRRFAPRRLDAFLFLMLWLACAGSSRALALGRGGSGESSGAGSEPWHWQKVTVAGAEGPLLAVTAEPSGSRVAVADAQGALLGKWTDASAGPGGWRRVARVRGIRDLYFDGDGALWIASSEGLWHLDAAGRLEERSPGPGEAARRISRVIASGELRVAVGAGGAFLSEVGGSWRRLLGSGVCRRPAGCGPVAYRYGPALGAVVARGSGTLAGRSRSGGRWAQSRARAAGENPRPPPRSRSQRPLPRFARQRVGDRVSPGPGAQPAGPCRSPALGNRLPGLASRSERAADRWE